MTKKELLENDLFKSLPDDAEIVFGTNNDLWKCIPLNALNISVIKQCLKEPFGEDMPKSMRDHFAFSPQYKNALVIDAIPYWYLKEMYHITLNVHEQE